MFRGVAVKKKINARETEQIGISLRIRELVPLSKSSDTCHYILYSVKYFILVHANISATSMINAKLQIICERIIAN